MKTATAMHSKNTAKPNIVSKSDLLTGMYLSTRIPDEDLDETVLHTIKDDCPDFILPFNYLGVNGETEFIYKVGTLSKLRYFYGEMSHTEYIALWRGLLTPLLECADWFMRASCFVLDPEFLYYDKNKKTVAYVYIPTLRGCSGAEAFSEMAVEISKNIKISDPVLENKVLRSILNDFNPGDFLKMLVDHLNSCIKENPQVTEAAPEPAASGKEIQNEEETFDEVHEAPVEWFEKRTDDDRIKEYKPKTRSLAGKHKKEQEKPQSGNIKQAQNTSDTDKLQDAGSKENGPRRNGFRNTVSGSLLAQIPPEYRKQADDTQEVKLIPAGTGLRCIGHAKLPQFIDVDMEDGELFTIGRYDANVGKKRSSFEFETKTKAISRRHAALERDGGNYRIVDLASSAGTFINDRKIPPNMPVDIEPGYRVSFGNMGADYVWEVC